MLKSLILCILICLASTSANPLHPPAKKANSIHLPDKRADSLHPPTKQANPLHLPDQQADPTHLPEKQARYQLGHSICVHSSFFKVHDIILIFCFLLRNTGTRRCATIPTGRSTDRRASSTSRKTSTSRFALTSCTPSPRSPAVSSTPSNGTTCRRNG